MYNVETAYSVSKSNSVRIINLILKYNIIIYKHIKRYIPRKECNNTIGRWKQSVYWNGTIEILKLCDVKYKRCRREFDTYTYIRNTMVIFHA